MSARPAESPPCPPRILLLLISPTGKEIPQILKAFREPRFAPELRRIASISDLRLALEPTRPDVILIDATLPERALLEAIECARSDEVGGLDIPVIVLSDDIHERIAFDVMRAGAADLLLKSNVSMLPFAVARVQREARERSERRKTEEELLRNREQLSLAVRTAKLGFYDWTIPSNRLILSEQMRADWGISPASDARDLEALLKLIHPSDLENVKRLIWQAIEERTPFHTNFRVPHPDGRVVWVEVSGSATYDARGRPIRFFGTSIDITDHKLREESLANALSARDDFLSIASHELRTPLTSLRLQAQSIRRSIMLGKQDAYSPERVERLAEQTEKQVMRISRLVEDMLDISRIRSGRLSIHKEMFDFSEMVQEVIVRLGPELAIFSGTPPRLASCPPAPGRWDRMRMEQVVANLLTNAMKYGDKKPIEVRVEVPEPDRVRLSIHDQGKGIPKESQLRIFDRFERAITAAEVSGLGLGLFICRELVEAHGGRIWVESEPERGSTFFVELPRSSAGTEGDQSAAA